MATLAGIIAISQTGRQHGIPNFIFTFFTFGPFSFFCGHFYISSDNTRYQVIIDRSKNMVTFGDSTKFADIRLPFQDWVHYGIEEEIKSKKRETS
jgi:hypothetical protein